MVEIDDKRERESTGQYTETAEASEVREAVVRGGHVVTASELSDVLETSRDTILRRLTALHESGEVERKQVGASAVVWWVADDE